MRVQNRKYRPHPGLRVLQFVLFLIVLAAVLKGIGWFVGGACSLGTDFFLG